MITKEDGLENNKKNRSSQNQVRNQEIVWNSNKKNKKRNKQNNRNRLQNLLQSVSSMVANRIWYTDGL